MKRRSSPVLCAALLLSLGLASSIRVCAQSEQVLHTFSPFLHGGNPQASLIADAQGNLYGTASTGGAANGGLVFKLTPTASGQWTETILHEFAGGIDGAQPLSGLIFDGAGNLYGTTSTGGKDDYGIIFELSPQSNGKWTERVLHTFTGNNDGKNPQGNLIFDAQGNLYGTTYYGGTYSSGNVFELSPSGQGDWTIKLLYEFTAGSDGDFPAAGVVFDPAGNLYGTTYGTPGDCSYGLPSCGTAFMLTPSQTGQWVETTLHTFTGGSDGSNPAGGLVFDAAGNLYGTASGGGSGPSGVVFELSPSSSGEWPGKTIYAFGAPGAGVQPMAGLIFDAIGNLYGTTFLGGLDNYCSSGGCGTVFELSPAAGGKWTPKTLHTFTGNLDGANPLASLILDAAGNLYGTTVTGVGANCTWTSIYFSPIGCGTVFRLSPSSQGQWTETQLYTFPGTDGSWPSGLSSDAAGNFYGTTYFGGTYGYGEVFKMSQVNGKWVPKTLYSFTGNADGNGPNGVIADSNGNLYGTTFSSAENVGCGVVFELRSLKGVWKERVLHAFSGVNTDGCNPVGNLVFDGAGNLYGATAYGGGAFCSQNGLVGCGIIFELSLAAEGQWTETILHSFPSSTADGVNPNGSLVFDASGTLYGTTLVGPGSGNAGTVFELSPSSSGTWSEAILYTFPQKAGSVYQPVADLIFDASGNLYGTAGYGGQTSFVWYGCGGVFKLSRSGGGWIPTTLYVFAGGNDGCNPQTEPILDASGNLYGETFDGGGPNNAGTVFELSPSLGSWNFNLLHTFSGTPDGGGPNGGLLFSSSGELFGVTGWGGAIGYGVVFEVVP